MCVYLSKFWIRYFSHKFLDFHVILWEEKEEDRMFTDNAYMHKYMSVCVLATTSKYDTHT